MVKILPFSLAVFLIYLNYVLACNDCSINCQTDCTSTNCQQDCRSTSCQQDCRSTSCQQNCGSTNCQQDCRSTSCCQTACSSRNCVRNCNSCQSPATNSPQIITTSREPIVTPVYRSPDISHNYDSHSNNITNINNETLVANFNITNQINLVNNLSIPITVTSNNKVDVNIVSSSSSNETPSSSSDKIIYINNNTCTSKDTDSSDKECITQTVTERVPVLIPIPSKPIYIQVPYPIVIPRGNQQQGCCGTITPCYENTCRSYQQTCGSSCMYAYQYQPINPCGGNGCYKRLYAPSWSCSGSSYCSSMTVDCNYCNDNNFYMNYNSFRQCGNCYYK
ncbi:uncharacterized protein [Diabrotica undecimpunctata]|uniref:uncharacterized protein n=1 Tax=Diabrotica undecimpunctata TaxID=50387 RepID=UPI003B63FBA7